MIKWLSLAILFIGLAITNVAAHASCAVDECDGKLICQNLEGAGYDNSETWVETGTPDEDYTTTVLRGSQSLFIDTGDEAQTPDFSAQSNIWAFYRFRTDDATPSVAQAFRMRDSGDATQGYVRHMPDGKIRIYSGTVNNEGSTTLLNDTEYVVWAHWVKGAGTADGDADLWLDTASNACSGGTCTRPVSTEATISAGTWDSADGNVVRAVYVISGTSVHYIVDQIYVSSTEISSVED